MQISADDYPALKAFFAWMIGNVIEPSTGVASSAVASLESFEARAPAMARKGLAMAIGDLVENLSGLTAGQVEVIDQALKADGILTLTEIRARFWSKIKQIRRRGSVRNEEEYYALRNVVEALPERDQQEVWGLLAAYEDKAAAK